MCVNDLTGRFLYVSSSFFFADDSQFYLADKIQNVNFCISKVNANMETVFLWAAKNDIRINASKSPAIIIRYVAVNIPYEDVYQITLGN